MKCAMVQPDPFGLTICSYCKGRRMQRDSPVQITTENVSVSSLMEHS